MFASQFAELLFVQQDSAKAFDFLVVGVFKMPTYNSVKFLLVFTGASNFCCTSVCLAHGSTDHKLRMDTCPSIAITVWLLLNDEHNILFSCGPDGSVCSNIYLRRVDTVVDLVKL